MKGSSGYAVFFYPQALEALGDTIKPYLQDSHGGPHVVCREIDTAGAFVEMTMSAVTTEGQEVALDLLVPTGMVRMIVSSQQPGSFGFRPHVPAAPAPGPVAAATGQAGNDPSRA